MLKMQVKKLKQLLMNNSHRQDRMVSNPGISKRNASHKSKIRLKPHRSSNRWKNINPLDTHRNKHIEGKVLSRFLDSRFDTFPDSSSKISLKRTFEKHRNKDFDTKRFLRKPSDRKKCSQSMQQDYNSKAPNKNTEDPLKIGKNATILRRFLQDRFKGSTSKESSTDLRRLSKERTLIAKAMSCKNLFTRRGTQKYTSLKQIPSRENLSGPLRLKGILKHRPAGKKM